MNLTPFFESFGGSRLLDDGQPIFWFPDRDRAIETARVMADARHQFNGKPTCVQTQNVQGEFELVFAFG